MMFSSYDEFEARTCLISSLLLTFPLYTFRIDVALVVIALALVINYRRTVFCIKLSLPFLGFFCIVALLLGGLSKIPTILALVCVGSFLLGVQPEKFGYALMYFRIPPKFAYSVSLAVRMFHVLMTDMKNIVELLRLEELGKLGFIMKLLKSLSAIAVVRALSIAEVLYSRGFDFDKRIVMCDPPKAKDFALLLASISILLYTCLTRSVL